MPARLCSTLSCTLLGLALLLSGCGNESDLDVAAGKYRLYVAGALTDTLSGPAVVRSRAHGRTGLELGPREGPGMSIELTSPAQDGDASQPQSGRYEVVGGPLPTGPRADSLTGLVAFLSVADAQFVATQGHLSVERGGNGTMGGRIEIEMAERGGTPGNRTVQVTGVLRATRP